MATSWICPLCQQPGDPSAPGSMVISLHVSIRSAPRAGRRWSVESAEIRACANCTGDLTTGSPPEGAVYGAGVEFIAALRRATGTRWEAKKFRIIAAAQVEPLTSKEP